jgi:hypothetical protein
LRHFFRSAQIRIGQIELCQTSSFARTMLVKTSARKLTGIALDYAFQLATYRQLAPAANGEARLSTLVKTKTVQLVQQAYRVSDADLKSTEVLYPLVQEGTGATAPTQGRLSFLAYPGCSAARR